MYVCDMIKHERSIELFKAINPAKKFTEFTFQELDSFSRVNGGDCFKGTILLIDGIYYMYSGCKYIYVYDPALKSIIRFKNGRNIIKEINL